MKISEVSAQTGLSVDTLRFYEKIGLIDPPPRDDGGGVTTTQRCWGGSGFWIS